MTSLQYFVIAGEALEEDDFDEEEEEEGSDAEEGKIRSLPLTSTWHLIKDECLRLFWHLLYDNHWFNPITETYWIFNFE